MDYLIAHPDIVARLMWEHIVLSGSALVVGAFVALPLGVVLARRRNLAAAVLAVLNVAYTIPSLGLMILLLPIFGLNAGTVVAALSVYATVILTRNVVAGIETVDPLIREAARAMGMTEFQLWWRVELPLSLPLLTAGFRVAAVTTIGIATIGAKFNAGGLGRLLFDGIAQAGRTDKIWAGALSVGALALATNALLTRCEGWFQRINHVERHDL